jgi:hypothetical protein
MDKFLEILAEFFLWFQMNQEAQKTILDLNLRLRISSKS